VKILLNGESREVPDGTSVAELLRRLELAPERVAIERNGRLVRRTEHAAVRLEEADRVEVVTLVGGG
jgi:sulfur carrier protein